MSIHAAKLGPYGLKLKNFEDIYTYVTNVLAASKFESYMQIVEAWK